MDDQQFNPCLLAALSSSGAVVGDILLYPFDTLAVRQKADRSISQGGSMIGQLQKIARKEGLHSLYRGVNTVMASTFLPNCLYFYVYECLNQKGKEYMLEQPVSQQKMWMSVLPIMSSACAEVIALLSYLPVDIVRTRLQLNNGYNYRSLWEGLKEVGEQEGVLRMYKGSHLYMCNYVSYTSIQFSLYEAMRIQILVNKQTGDQQQMRLGESLGVTGVCTAMATFMTSPIDIVFTRQQCMDGREGMQKGMTIYRQIVREEGYRALFKGLTAKTFQNCMMGALILPVYEYFKGTYGVNFHTV